MPLLLYSSLSLLLVGLFAIPVVAHQELLSSFEDAFSNLLSDLSFPGRIHFLSQAILTTINTNICIIPPSKTEALFFKIVDFTLYGDFYGIKASSGPPLVIVSLRDIHKDDVDYFASIFVILFPPLQRLKLFATSLDSSWRLATTSATAEDLLISRQLLSHFLGLLSTPTQILRRIHWPARPPRPMGTVFIRKNLPR